MPTKTFIVTTAAIFASWLPSLTEVTTGLSPAMALWALAALFSVAGFAFTRSREARFQRDTRLLHLLVIGVLMGLAGLALASASWATEPYRVLRVVAAIGLGVTCLVTIPFCCQNTHQTRQLVLAYVIAAAINGLVLTFFLLASADESMTWTKSVRFSPGRFALLFKHPNQTGIAISSAIPLACAVMLSKDGFEKHWRWLGGVTTALLFLGLVATGSKTNMIISGIAVLVMNTLVVAHETNRKRFLIKAVAVPLSLIAIAGLFVFVLREYNPRSFNLFNRLQDDGALGLATIENRLILWEESIRVGKEKLFTGMGAGARFDQLDKSYSQSHNLILEYFRTLGLPGLLLLVALLGLLLKSSFQTMSDRGISAMEYSLAIRLGLGLSVLSYLAANMMSDSMGPSTSPFLWISVGLCFATQVDPYAFWQANGTEDARRVRS